MALSNAQMEFIFQNPQLSAQQIADRIGCTRQTVSRIRNGKKSVTKPAEDVTKSSKIPARATTGSCNILVNGKCYTSEELLEAESRHYAKIEMLFNAIIEKIENGTATPQDKYDMATYSKLLGTHGSILGRWHGMEKVNNNFVQNNINCVTKEEKNYLQLWLGKDPVLVAEAMEIVRRKQGTGPE